jgi:hypothetical protein
VACLYYILYCAIVKNMLDAAFGYIGYYRRRSGIAAEPRQMSFFDLAKKYGAARSSVTALFLPMWYAHRTFRISTTVFILELIWLAWSYFAG